MTQTRVRVLDAGGRRWLFYAASGEQAIGVTEL